MAFRTGAFFNKSHLRNAYDAEISFAALPHSRLFVSSPLALATPTYRIAAWNAPSVVLDLPIAVS